MKILVHRRLATRWGAAIVAAGAQLPFSRTRNPMNNANETYRKHESANKQTSGADFEL